MKIVPFDQTNRVSNKLEETYRSYLLTCSQDNKQFVGEVFKQDVRVAYCECLDLDSAQQHLRRIVDWHIKDAIKLRSNEEPDFELWCMATMQTLYDASRQEKDILYTLSHCEVGFVELAELANLALLSNTAEVNYVLSDFARRICDFIPYEPPYPGDGRDPYLALACESSPMNDSVRLSSVFRTILKNYRP